MLQMRLSGDGRNTGVGLIGNRFVGELKDDGNIVGTLTPAIPFNVMFVRSDAVSGTCAGAPIYSPP